jgi:hypothetical protein
LNKDEWAVVVRFSLFCFVFFCPECLQKYSVYNLVEVLFGFKGFIWVKESNLELHQKLHRLDERSARKVFDFLGGIGLGSQEVAFFVFFR